jgi:hypothetical protein
MGHGRDNMKAYICSILISLISSTFCSNESCGHKITIQTKRNVVNYERSPWCPNLHRSAAFTLPALASRLSSILTYDTAIPEIEALTDMKG